MVAIRRNGGNVAPTVGKNDARRDSGALGVLCLALLVLCGCLNPRPDEFPSALEPAPGGASDVPSPSATAAPDNERAANPRAGPSEDPVRPESSPVPAAPPPPLDLAARPDAGADAGATPDSGAGDAG